MERAFFPIGFQILSVLTLLDSIENFNILLIFSITTDLFALIWTQCRKGGVSINPFCVQIFASEKALTVNKYIFHNGLISQSYKAAFDINPKI